MNLTDYLKSPRLPLYEDLEPFEQAQHRLAETEVWLDYKEHIETMKFDSDPENWTDDMF